MQRHLPELDFPPYAFIPGQHPHPTRHPEGHSYGHEEAEVDYLTPSEWRQSSDYLFGVDLYNHGFYWEAHEAWEGLWLAARAQADDEQALFLQGLIQLAAASLKIPMNQPSGFVKLANFGTEKLKTVAKNHSQYMGLDLEEFIATWREFASNPSPTAKPVLWLQLS